jgi:protein involved in temperature-dependent protein secretion
MRRARVAGAQVGMVRLSSSAGVTIFYSSFLIEVQESYQSALSQLQLARKMSPNICQKFTIFVRCASTQRSHWLKCRLILLHWVEALAEAVHHMAFGFLG